MLAWLFELLTSIITFVLGLFGIDYKGKTVSFADESADSEKKNEEHVESNNASEVTETKTEEESTKSE